MIRLGYKRVITFVTMKYDRKDVEFFGIIRNRVVYTVKGTSTWEEVFQMLGTHSNSTTYLKEVVVYRK